MKNTSYKNKTLKELAKNVVNDCVGIYRTYNIGFNDGDETQFDALCFSDLQECWNLFCKDNGFRTDSVDYIEHIG